MGNFHTDPDGKRWRLTSGYSGHRRREDGSMYFDVHTGQGTAAFWVEVGPPAPPPEVCDGCGYQIDSGMHKYVHKCEEKAV